MHPWPTDVQKIRLDGLQVTWLAKRCVVVEIDRQKKLLHIGSDLGKSDLKGENVACTVPLQTVSLYPQIWGKWRSLLDSVRGVIPLASYGLRAQEVPKLALSFSCSFQIPMRYCCSFPRRIPSHWKIFACHRHSDSHHVLLTLCLLMLSS